MTGLSPLDALMLTALAAWLAVAVLAQVGRQHWAWLRSLDALGILPEWRFFAPNPVRFDYHLLYRDRLLDGSLTEWTEVWPRRARRWSAAVWNPDLRRDTPIEEAVIEIFRRLYRLPDTDMMVTPAYALLLNVVAHQPRWVGSVGTQFMVGATHGAGQQLEPRLVYVSGFHALEGA